MKYFWLSLFILGVTIHLLSSLIPGETTQKMVDSIIEVIATPDENSPVDGEVISPNTSFLTRKVIGHFLLSGIVSFCGYLTFYAFKRNRQFAFYLMLILGLFIAFFSEGLQYLGKNRYPSLEDVGINYLGSLCFLIAIYLTTSLKSWQRST